MTNVKIVGMRLEGFPIDVGALVSKQMTPGTRHRYTQAVVYSLEDGREVPGNVRGATRPKLTAAIESRHLAMHNDCLEAGFDDKGDFQWVSTLMGARAG